MHIQYIILAILRAWSCLLTANFRGQRLLIYLTHNFMEIKVYKTFRAMSRSIHRRTGKIFLAGIELKLPEKLCFIKICS